MLPREIQAEHWPERTTYNLPTRPIGSLRWIGLVPVAFGLAFASVPLHWMAPAIPRLLRGQAETSDLVSFLFPLVFVIAALIPVGLGLLIVMGRTRLVVTRDYLRITELAAFIRRSRKLRVADIERLAVMNAPASQGPSAAPQWLARLGALSAKMRDGKTRLVLLGYPAEWIEALAEEISGYLKVSGGAVQVERGERPLAPEPAPLPDLAQPPANTNIRKENRPDGLHLDVPPLGLRGGSAGMFAMSIFWCLILGVITFAIFRGGGRHGLPWPAVPFIAVFWAVGLAMLYGSLRMGRRRVALHASGTQLSAQQRDAFKTRSYRWQRSEITAIRAGESNMKVNNKPVMELQVLLANRKKVALASGRTAEELAWLATELRTALNLPADQPADSRTADFERT